MSELKYEDRVGGQLEGTDLSPELDADDQAIRATLPRAKWRGSFSSGTWDAWLVGIFAFVLSAIGSDRSALHHDEATTHWVTSQTLPQLWHHLTHGGEGFHGLYYFVLDIWRSVVPSSDLELTLRLPSALAAGLAAAGVVTVGKQLSLRSVAVTAGVVFALLPRVTYAGSEARPYAFTMAAAVWLTALCVLAARRGRAAPWLGYGVALVVAGVLHGYLLLILPAHWVAVKMTASTKGSLKYWFTAVAGALVLLVPFQLAVVSEYKLSGYDFGSIWAAIDGLYTRPYFAEFGEPTLPAVLVAVTLLATGRND